MGPSNTTKYPKFCKYGTAPKFYGYPKQPGSRTVFFFSPTATDTGANAGQREGTSTKCPTSIRTTKINAVANFLSPTGISGTAPNTAHGTAIAPTTEGISSYSNLYLLNIQGLIPTATSNSKWKIPYTSDTILNSEGISCPFMSITETWTKSYIRDAQLHIENYNIYRSDRNMRSRGGAMLYIHESLPVSNSEIFDDATCEGVSCVLESIKFIVVSVYRPPDATHSFKNLLCSLQKFMDSINSDEFTIYITGDFNFPNINWETLTATQTLGSQNSQSSEALIGFMERNFLNQIVRSPTRYSNILDIVLTNSGRDIIEVNSAPTLLSDHNLVEIKLGYDLLKGGRGQKRATKNSVSIT